MPYPFLGNSARTYPQYINTDTGRPLEAVPGGVYDMAPVPGAYGLPVPPGDGLWPAPPEPDPAKTKSSKGAPAARKGA